MAIVTKKVDFTRVFELIHYQKEKYPNQKAFNSFSQGQWKSQSTEEIQNRINALSCWFLANQFKAGEKIIFVPVIGSPDWVILDFACQQVGLIVVPIHPTLNENEFNAIVTETEARLCITLDEGLYFKFFAFKEKVNAGLQLFHLQPEKVNFFKPIQESKTSHDLMTVVTSFRNTIGEDDIVTLLYTSGSTGLSKGVMLSHRNIVHNIKAVLTILPLEPGDRVLSFLPFSHIFERASCYVYIAFGTSLYFSQNKESFVNDFRTVRPIFCSSVPRVLEKMYDYMEEQTLGKNILKKKLITWAMNVGKHYGPEKKLKPIYQLELIIARLLVLRQWRERLGGKIKYMAVGAASLRPDIGRLFSAADIYIVEGYGMTEAAPLISMNRFEPGLNRFGTVGLPLPGVEVRIDNPNENNEGEILVKGPNVMKGYYKKPELTAETITPDGWFHTGDIGKFVYKRFLKITDRKKDIFKTSSGKYIAPQQLENHLKQSLFIERCMIIGFQRPYVTALIVPQFESVRSWCDQNDIHWTAPQFMVHNIKVRAKFQQEIDKLNKELPHYETIRSFVLCHQDWSIEKGEVTPTWKPIRKQLEKNYELDIDKLYR
ncbi:MAG: long-chain fatty acid--CoA ligase [Flammeovirgaceae bacterium]|jgi:long-chain acyl-CoA synthetase|nr:long-chain fatty acid--CoA ligase [Flammeovirgaceae bacterium]